MPQTNSSKRSATRGSAGSRRASAACAAGQWVRKAGLLAAELRLDALQQQAEEQILPGFVGAQRHAPAAAAERRSIIGGGQQIGADIAGEGLGEGKALEAARSVVTPRHSTDGRQHGAQQGDCLGDQPVERGAGAVPFEHGEFGRVQVAALAVPPHARELENRAGAADQQLLHREFRAGVQPERVPLAGRGDDMLGAEGGEMHLLAGRGHGVRGFDLGVAAGGEEGARRGRQQRAAAEIGRAGGEALGVPGGRGRLRRHGFRIRQKKCRMGRGLRGR